MPSKVLNSLTAEYRFYTNAFSHEIDFGGLVVRSAISLATMHPISRDVATIAKKIVNIYRSIRDIHTRALSVNKLKEFTHFLKEEKDKIALHLFRALLLPFSILNLIEYNTKLQLLAIHRSFQKVPVFGKLRFAGVLTVLQVGLFLASLSIAFKKRHALLQEKKVILTDLVSLENSKKTERVGSLYFSSIEAEVQRSKDKLEVNAAQIKNNRYGIVEKVAMLASILFFAVVKLLSYTHPLFFLITLAEIGIEVGLGIGSYLSEKTIQHLTPLQLA